MGFCPGNVEKLSFSPQNVSDLSPRFIWGVFPLLQAPRYIHTYMKLPATLTFFFDSTRSNKYDTNPKSDRQNVFLDPIHDRSPSSQQSPPLDRKGGADGDFLQPGPLRSGKDSPIDLGENYDTYILRRERPIFNIYFRGKSSWERAERDFFNRQDSRNKSDRVIRRSGLRVLSIAPPPSFIRKSAHLK